jgi:hypothetical protein
MRLIYSTCDYCGQGTHTVQFDGGGYCSTACASRAELAKRNELRDLRTRRDIASTRQAETTRAVDAHRALIAGMGLLCLLLLALIGSGCDSPQDYYGSDERAHVSAGHRIVRDGL